MKTPIWFSITPQSPIHIGSIKPNLNFLETKEAIPGAVVRGAIAEYFLYQNKENKIKNFINKLRFGFFRPSKFASLLSLPLPITAMTCKKHPGFLSEGGHGIFDTLIPMIVYYELKKLGGNFVCPFLLRCEKCKARAEKEKGFYIKEKNYEKVEIYKFSQTKVAINPKTKTTEEEMLYSVTALKPKVVFCGKIFIEEEKIKVLKEAVEKVGIGSLTTRGYGRVVFEKEDNLLNQIENIKERFEKFNNKIKKVWNDLLSITLNQEKLPQKPQHKYFAITLISPAILKDETGLPSLNLKISLNGKVYTPILKFVTSEFIGGWSTGWGLPKETTIGTQIGSVFVFKINQQKEALILKEFEELEQIGIGERKEEGYGEILVCHPFHQEVIPV